MWTLVYKEADGVTVDGNLEHKIWRCAGLHHLPDYSIMVRMDQRFIQVQHQHLPFYQT